MFFVVTLAFAGTRQTEACNNAVAGVGAVEHAKHSDMIEVSI
jgi:hypothetical protein